MKKKKKTTKKIPPPSATAASPSKLLPAVWESAAAWLGHWAGQKGLCRNWWRHMATNTPAFAFWPHPGRTRWEEEIKELHHV